jgi:type II pantothenate kinase
MILGLDFGLTNLDGALGQDGQLLRGWRQPTQGPASEKVMRAALETGGVNLHDLTAIGTTGGRHKDLPSSIEGVPIRPIGEAQSVGRGGLALGGLTVAGLEAALVVSAGTGTSMISARRISKNGETGYELKHVTGSAVGGGTLLGLGKLLLGTSNPLEIGELASRGDPAGVDSTLVDVIGGGIGHLPADATAVNLGRLVKLQTAPTREDLAAGLVTLVSQVIAVIALNAAAANNLERIVIVGHLPDLEPIQVAIRRVWGFYGVPNPPIFPENAGFATALGAALEAGEDL